MKKSFLLLLITSLLFIDQLNAQHLRARPTSSREASRDASRSRDTSRSSARQPSNSRQPSHSRQPQTTTTTTTTTTPTPTTQPEDDSNPKYYGTYLGSFETKVHGVSGDIFAVDESTVFVKNFFYDGEGPDAYFWYGSTDLPDENGFIIPDEKDFHYDGQGPGGYFWASSSKNGDPKISTGQNSQGLKIPDENGSLKPLRRYAGETIVISLPDNKTIYDYDYFGVFCEYCENVDFGHTRIPHNILVPPSAKMLGVKHESKLNCEVLLDAQGLELRWVMDADDVVLQLVGKLESNDYMAFGLSKNDTKSEMIGSDVVVAYFDTTTGRGHAIDYNLESKQQCTGSAGSCPDIKLSSNASDSITLLHAAVVNGFTMVTFKRPLVAVDDIYDQHVFTDGPQAIVWAVGSLNQRKEVSYHYNKVNRNNFFIDFARRPKWNCPSPHSSSPSDKPENSQPPTGRSVNAEVTTVEDNNKENGNIENFHNVEVHDLNREVISESKNDKEIWKIPPINCPADKTFRVQLGPTGGKRLTQITGKVGWGVSFWVNGVMAPEIVVERGTTYNFIIETGNDPVHTSRRHQFYITDSSEGGFHHKSFEDQTKEKIYAGVEVLPDNTLVPTEGRLCVWQVNTSLPDGFENKVDFLEFKKTLNLKCDESSSPTTFTWTPDENTPDNLYYQCFTHRYLGWKIRVVDSCDHLTSASIQEDFPIRIKPNQITYVERTSKHNWHKNHTPLQNQQINKIKQKIRKNQNVKFQVKPTTISAPIPFESTRIRTPQSLSSMIFKEDVNRNQMTNSFSKIDRLPKKQIKELKLQLAKNVSLIPTIQDRQLLPAIITPVLSTRKLNMNRGRPRAKQINENTVTYVRHRIASSLPTLINYQIKPSKAQYLKQAQKLDLDRINYNLQGGFYPIQIGFGQTIKPRKEKKLQVNLPVHLPINMPVNLPLSLSENELSNNNLIVNSLNQPSIITNEKPPISLVLKKQTDISSHTNDHNLKLIKDVVHHIQPSSISTTTISSLIIPQTRRIISYLSGNNQDDSSNGASNKFSSQPAINVNLKLPTTIKLPKLPTTANPFISSLHPFTVKQIIKSMEQGNEHRRLAVTKPNKKLNKLTIRPRSTTTTSTTTTTTTTTTEKPSTTTTTTTTTQKPKEIFAANFDPINFGDLSSSSYYHSVHVVPPKKQELSNNKQTTLAPDNKSQSKLNNHQLGLIDFNKQPRASSTRVSVTKYQPTSNSNQVDDAILSHVLSLITNGEPVPEINLNSKRNKKPAVERPVIRDDDLNNLNYFDNSYEVELHEKLTK